VGEELRLTLDALEELYSARRAGGWELRVYDYSTNAWKGPEKAFSTPGTYEMAILTPPDGRPVKVRVLPPGATGLSVDAASIGELGVWRALGVDLKGRHVEAVVEALEGREGPVPLQEIATLLEGVEGDAASEARKAILATFGDGGGGP
jgi:hypothetical protein